MRRARRVKRNGQSGAAARIAAGALAGIAGTVLLGGVRAGTQKLAPEAMPQERQDPGEFMVERADARLPAQAREEIPEKAEQAIAASTHFGYGATAGAIFGALRSYGSGNVLLDGALFGAGVWALGYLGWLPALRLVPPVTRQTPTQISVSIAQHALYGVVTAAAYREIAKRT